MSAGDIIFSDDYTISLGGIEKLHPFDIHKYSKIVSELRAKGLVGANEVLEPEAVTDQELELVHTRSYLETMSSAKSVATYLEAPILGTLPDRIIERNVVASFRASTGGSILAARRALETGVAINVGGGYHHAKPDIGEGFNLFNDIAIAIRVLQEESRIERALVIDLDVHQGNGTAVCFEDDETVFTFSMHEQGIYPLPKEASDLDVGLDSGLGDDDYLAVLDEHWPPVLDGFAADIVVYQAGCDVLANDPLAGLEMTPEGVRVRDARVIDACVEREIPVVMLLGGGYSKDAWTTQFESIRQILGASVR